MSIYWDRLAKPIDGLGEFERIIDKLGDICGTHEPDELRDRVSKRALIIFCADHGVVCEGVSQTDKAVTRTVMENMERGSSSAVIMADKAGVDSFIIDVGVDCENYPCRTYEKNRIIDKKIKRGSGNIASEPAMSAEEFDRAFKVGEETIKELKKKGYNMFLTGEMGIGNTTPTAALVCALLNKAPRDIVGRGAGLSDEGLSKKIKTVERALERVGKMTDNDIRRIVSELGGFEIAALSGAFCAACKENVPIVIDGAISAVAALTAYRLTGNKESFIASHISREPAAKAALSALKLRGVIDAEMKLGEGTGALMLSPLIDMALSVYAKLPSFDACKIEEYRRY